ncbi:hypothetical protein GH5_05074 [Leishmania sp. Ghana 2012 LV757]|uniref:hypothetical protein n=1 Tax=Leishmania sp. Ghana 2012 LV757 TaxID=2803181 RepID=UPI001B798840|nr:hypothetical protein GH5_05074 [Leishmania sp. Ghana 2012 LV757]
MQDSDAKRMSYDMPQDQLNYFDSRAKASSTFVTPTSVHLLYDKWTPGCNHEMQRCTQERLKNGEHDLPTVTRQGSLLEKYQQYFGGHPRESTEGRSFKADSAAFGLTPDAGSNPHEAPESNSSTPRLASRVSSRAPLVEPGQPSVRAKPSSQLRSHRDAAANTSNLNWGRSGLPMSRSDTPREQLSGNNSSTNRNISRVAEYYSGRSRNQYEQPRCERQAPFSKLSLSCGTGVSRDSPSEASTNAQSQNEESVAPQRPQAHPAMAYSHVPRQVEMIRPVREVESQQVPSYWSERPTMQGMVDKNEHMDDEEENCTFHPNIHNLPGLQRRRVQRSTVRSREETYRPRSSRGDYEQSVYDKMHYDAVAAKQRSDSHRVQKELNDAQNERNTAHGSFLAFRNPNRSATERPEDTEEVFSRLYADAQRYNREKFEQERLIELKRRQERGEVPYDSEKDGKANEDSPSPEDNVAASGEEKPAAAKPRTSTPRAKSCATPAVFERLSRPHKVTVKFEQQKKEAEQEMLEKEQKDTEAKESETAKFAGYRWGVPAKSFTFSDMESHNSLYTS